MKTILFLLATWLCSATAFPQATLHGKVTDAKTKEPLLFAAVTLHKNGILITGMETDFEGNFFISSIDPGTYDIEAAYVGYEKRRIIDVQVLAGKNNRLDIELSSENVLLEEVVVTEYRIPLIEQDNMTSGSVITSDRIRNMPTRNIRSKAGRAAGLKSRKGRKGTDDEAVHIRGSHSAVTDYYIDGIRVSGGDVAGGAASGRATSAPAPGIAAGQLTSGEWTDLNDWETWTELMEEDFQPYVKAWELAPKMRFSVEVRNPKGTPIVNCQAQLKNKAGAILWSARTDNNGRAELWGAAKSSPQYIELEYQDIQRQIEKPQAYAEGVNHIRMDTECPQNQAADVLFVVDATSSMADEINYLKAELEDAILRVKHNLSGVELRTGALFYRDHQDEYLTRNSALTPNLDSTLAFIRRQRAGGGGDGPEAVEVALKEALEQQQWNPEASARLIFFILDAPPHQQPEIRQSLKQSIQEAAKMGIKIIPITGSGIGKSTEYLMRAMAIHTNGAYTYITNHSGIGGSHIEPTAGPYEVILLNDLIVKLILENTVVQPCPEEAAPAVASANNLNPALLAQVKCFPNPTTGQFYLRLSEGFTRLVIRNLMGQQMEVKTSLDKGDHEFNVEQWPPGLYLLELHKNNEVAIEKLIVERRP